MSISSSFGATNLQRLLLRSVKMSTTFILHRMESSVAFFKRPYFRLLKVMFLNFSS